jgi:hypothetical protein
VGQRPQRQGRWSIVFELAAADVAQQPSVICLALDLGAWWMVEGGVRGAESGVVLGRSM